MTTNTTHPKSGVRYSIQDTFWQSFRERLVTITLPHQLTQLQERGRLENFRRAAARSGEPTLGIYSFDDTDVYKWVEAVCSCLATLPHTAETASLAASMEEIVEQIAAAQEPDGYLNTYYTGERAGQRWQNSESHELYAAGHLIQAAIAHHAATGKTTLLQVAVRFADLLVAKGTTFLDSHPLIELALAQLAQVTGTTAYLHLAQAHLDARGYGRFGRPYRYFEPSYAQDHKPFRELDEVVGHAVRMVYLAAGATQIGSMTNDVALRSAVIQQWDNLSRARVYVTGGIGSNPNGEAFGRDFELPSLSAYAETCAAVGSVYWNEVLLAWTGEPRYAELMERTLYNAALVGISLAGDSYSYENPLASDGTHRRKPWFDCACCPPNIARLLAVLPRLVAQTVGEDTLRLTLWMAGTGEAALGSGAVVRWTAVTTMPWEGVITLTWDTVPDEPFTLELRIPQWSEAPCLLVGEEIIAQPEPGTYFSLKRVWSAGEQLTLVLPMPVRRLVAHPQLVDAAGRVALQRGPLIYCIEGGDHPGLNLHALRLPPTSELRPLFRPELLGGVVALEGEAVHLDLSGWDGVLYTTDAARPAETAQTPIALVAIPYFTSANRSPCPMLVWIPT